IFRVTSKNLSLWLFAAIILLFALSSTRAQLPDPTRDRKQPLSGDQKNKDDVDFGSRESAARTDLVLKAEKKAYDEHVARAKEAALIAAELKNAFETKQAFAPDDRKKLDRLEKLTRRIRNEAGGSESDPEMKDIPQTTDAAVRLLADETEDLRKEVEKTPRHVISAAVIDCANKLVGLIDFIRREQ